MSEPQEGEGGLKCLGYKVFRDNELVRVTRINLGCGHTKFLDSCNVDISGEVDPDVMFDVTQQDWPFQESTFSSVYCSHLLEHLTKPLPFMEELARVCCPGALAMFRLPYGSSDNAWEDPTHVRPYFLDSFGYFSQAAYGGADYGYRGDWSVVKRELTLKGGRGFEQFSNDLETMLAVVMIQRNVVDEYRVVCRNIKPPRTPATAREASPVFFQFQSAPTISPSNDQENPS